MSVAPGEARWNTGRAAAGLIALCLVVCLVGGTAVALLARGGLPSSPASATETTGRSDPTDATLGEPESTATAPTVRPSRPAGPDPYEPDDDISSASLIAAGGQPQQHSLHKGGDLDYVSFRAQAGHAYTIGTSDLGAEIDTVIFLYDAQGQGLAHNDDGAEESVASRLVWMAPSSGRYYVLIRDLGEDSFGPNTWYSVSVTESAVAEGADAFEPDDDFASARAIAVDGAPQTHTFHTSTDVDFVYFEAEEGQKFVMETGDLQGECDTVLSLYDQSGTELAYDDDAGEEALSSRIEWTAESAGTYYVKISDFRGRAGPEVSYQISVVTG
jgi:hypothetical protein